MAGHQSSRPYGEALAAPRPAGEHGHLLGQREAHRRFPLAANSVPVRRCSQPSALSQYIAAKAGSRSVSVRESLRSWLAKEHVGGRGREPHQEDRGRRFPRSPRRGCCSRTTPSSVTSSAKHSITRPVSTCRTLTASLISSCSGRKQCPSEVASERVELQAGLDPLRAIGRDAHRLGDGVGGFEPDPPHVGGQTVRLVADHADRRIGVLLVTGPGMMSGARRNGLPLFAADVLGSEVPSGADGDGDARRHGHDPDDGWDGTAGRAHDASGPPGHSPGGPGQFRGREHGLAHPRAGDPSPPAGAQAGQRVPGSDGKVDESRSLGEASASCAAGSGEGISAGAVGWTTVTLPAGRTSWCATCPTTTPTACAKSWTSIAADLRRRGPQSVPR